MPLQKLPTVDLDNVNHRRGARERINQILDHSFDDSRRQTPAEKLAGVTPVNYAYAPGHFHRYGAVGDNATDDSLAIQAAFDSGSIVTAIAGFIYYCGTTQIDIPANSRASLYGVALRTAVNGTTFLNCTGGEVEIHGVEVYGRGNSSVTSNEILFKFSGADASNYLSGLLIKDCYFHDVGQYAIFSQFGADADVAGCYFDDIGYAAVIARSARNWRVNGNFITDVSPGSGGQAYGVVFDRDDSSTGVGTYPAPIDCEACNNIVKGITVWEALDTHGGSRITFSNNLIFDCKYGINVSPIPAVPLVPNDITITGNVIFSGSLSSDPGRAIGSGGYDSSNKTSNLIIANNIVKSYGLDANDDGAIMVQYTKGAVIIGNVVEDSRGSAICILQSNADFLVSGNAVRGVRSGVANATALNIRNTTQTGHVAGNYLDATAEIGMVIANTSTGVSFSGNRVVTSGTRFSSALYAGDGLEMEGSTTTDRGSIANGAQDQFGITVAGAEIGDYVVGIACDISTQALSLTGTVTAADTVTAVLQNNTGSAVDLANATYTALVRKR